MLQLSDLATLNSLKPAASPTVTTGTPTEGSATVTNSTGLGDLNPLLGDLVKFNQAPNSYMRSSYTFDPTAVQDKLNTYSALSDADYAKYSPLLTGMDPALHTGGNYLFNRDALTSQLGKYSTLDPIALSQYSPLLGDLKASATYDGGAVYDKDALSAQLAKYSGLNADEFSKYSPLLGDLKATTTLDGNAIFDKNALSSQLGKYSGMSLEDYAKYSPLLGDVQGIEAGGVRYFDPTALNNQLGKYSTLDDERYAQYQPLLTGMNPTANIGGQNYFDSAALANQLGKYSTIDASKLTGEDAITKALKARLKTVGDQTYINSDEANYYQTLSDAVNKSRIGYYGMNSIADPFTSEATYDWRYNNVEPVAQVTMGGKSYVYTPYELAARIQGDKESDKLNYLTDFLGNEDLFSKGQVVNLPQNVIDQIMYGRTGTKENPTINVGGGSAYGTDWQFDNPGLGYLLSQEDFDNYVINKGGAGSGFDTAFSGANGNVNTGHGVHDESSLMGSWILRNTQPAPVSAPVVPAEYQWDKSKSWMENIRLKNAFGSAGSNPPQEGIVNDYDLTGSGTGGLGTLLAAKNTVAPASTGGSLGLSKVPAIGASLDKSPWVAQSSKDPNLFSRFDTGTNSWHQSAFDQYQTGGGGFLGSVGKVFDAIAPILAFTPLAPYAAAYQMGKGIGSGNIGQIIGGGLGAFGGNIVQGLGGAEGQSLGSLIGDKLGAGAGSIGTAVGNSLIGSGMGLINGQSLGDALKGGAIGGLASYGGGLLGDQLNSTLKDAGVSGNIGASNYAKLLSNLGGNLGSTTISSILRGGDLNSALKNSLINSGIGGLGQIAGRNLNFKPTPKG